jgi:hypothetical protein
MAGSEPCRQHRHDRLAGGFRRLPAAQPTDFGAKGFFASYDARLDQPLTIMWAGVWAKTFDHPQKRAAAVRFAESQKSPPTRQTLGKAHLHRCGKL